MPDQRSSGHNSVRPPALRRRSQSSAPRGRGQPGRQQPQVQPYQPPVTHYPPPSAPPDAAAAPLSFTNLHGQYQHPLPAPFAQRGPYMGGQYTISPPASAGMVLPTSAPQYAYPSHPGLVAPDPSMHPQNQLIGYSPNTLVPMMPSQPPVYGFSTHAHSEATNSASGSYASNPSATTPLYSPVPPSSSPHSPLQSSSPYGQQYPPSAYIYPPHSFAHSGTTLFPGQYAYGQQYRPSVPVPGERETTWWYMPPGPGPPPSAHYEAYSNPYQVYNLAPPHQEVDYSARPSHSTPSPHPSSSVYPMPPPMIGPPFSPAPPLPQPQHIPAPDPPPPPQSEPPSRAAVSEPARSEPPSTPSLPSRSQHDRPSATRRAYHPNAPPNRSEWVMWAGNVPSDASHDELWRFFNQPITAPVPSPEGNSAARPTSSTSSASASSPAPPSAPASGPSGTSPGHVQGGVLSIFLIQRSNCAFVNFQSEAHLHAAIAFFNGKPLRQHDLRCPRLVCRVRGRDDDLKAGVGGQRGAGLHVQWIKDQTQRQLETALAASSPEPSPTEQSNASSSVTSDATGVMASLSLSNDDDGGQTRRLRRPAHHSNSSGSYASTNSSMLSQYFPKRYFILKSLTQFDLDLSVEKGLWATQRHNEGILDQAYRTSKEVYLIFGVNKSGEFYGYARMAGPVLRGEHRVSWASRSSIDSPPTRRASTSTGAGPSPSMLRQPQYLSPSETDRYEESPLPMDTPQEKWLSNRDVTSAPAVMHRQHRPLSKLSSTVPHHGELSYNEARMMPVVPALLAAKQDAEEEFHLDPSAPLRAAKHRTSVDSSYVDEEGIRRWDAAVGESMLEAVEEEEEQQHAAAPQPKSKGKGRENEPAADAGEGKTGEGKTDEGPTWGESFKIEWIKSERLPFYRTRNLRNPWNHDREVKVSRDGTELEPSVGQALLDEWNKPDTQQGPPPRTKSTPPDKAAGQS